MTSLKKRDGLARQSGLTNQSLLMAKPKLPVSNKEAKLKGRTTYFTGRPCKYGHYSERFTKNRNCRECLRLRNLSKTKKDYWVSYGSEQYKEKKRAYAKRYYYNHKLSENSVNRYAKRRLFEKLSKIATDAGKIQVRRVKISAQMLTIDTGIEHEMDHIIPIINASVCGLEVPTNVRVVTKKENRRKAARFDQEKQSIIQMVLLKKKPSEEG